MPYPLSVRRWLKPGCFDDGDWYSAEYLAFSVEKREQEERRTFSEVVGLRRWYRRGRVSRSRRTRSLANKHSMDVLWVGSEGGMEADLVTRARDQLHNHPSRGCAWCWVESAAG